MNLACERGAARLTTAVRMGVFMVIVAVIAFDLSAIVVNIFQLDDLSRDAAQAAAQAWRGAPRAAVVETAVEHEVASSSGTVEVSRIALDTTTVWVTLRRPPAVIVLDKLPAMRDRLDISVTQRATLDPSGL